MTLLVDLMVTRQNLERSEREAIDLVNENNRHKEEILALKVELNEYRLALVDIHDTPYGKGWQDSTWDAMRRAKETE